MYGGIIWQVQEIFKKSGINRIGESKHNAKESARNELQASGRKANWHALGKEMGIYSYATADAYRDVWRLLGNFAKAEFKVKDMEKLTGVHVQAFLESKIAADVTHATFLQYAAACEKLETALNSLAVRTESGRAYDFSEQIADARADAHKMLLRFEGSRAYTDPDRLVAAVRDSAHQLAAAIQRESGCRIREANRVTPGQLRGLREDVKTGQAKGWIEVKGKGGKVREVGMSPATYAKLKASVSNTGKRFEFNPDAYRRSLKAAAQDSGQGYEGSHGLRWSWAQERFQELQQNGASYAEAMVRVSHEMGHERGDITEHYLR